MKKFAIVDDKGNIVFSSKSDKKVIRWMVFNAKWDPDREIGMLQDDRMVHFETFALA